MHLCAKKMEMNNNTCDNMMEVDINKIIKPYRILFKAIGVWPGVTGWFSFFLLIASLLFTLIFMLWNIFFVYDDLELLMNTLVNMFGCILGLLKLLVLRTKRRNMEFIINVISNDWIIENKENVNRIMSKNLIRSRLVCNMFLISYNCMSITFIFKGLFSYLFDEVEDRQFLFQSYFPINATISPIYEIILILQTIALIICMNSNAISEGFLTTLALHACTKMDTVRREIVKYSNICRIKKRDKRLAILTLKKLWLKHLQFLKFAEAIPDIFSFISFYNITFVTMLQVVLTFLLMNMITNVDFSVNSLHCIACNIACLLNSGYYCVIGEYLTNQSKLIFDYLYQCPWYEFQPSDMKFIIFMLMRARNPVYLKFGKFNNLSLQFLTIIYKTTFSYFSILRATR